MDDVNIVYNKEQRNSAFEDLDAYDVQVLGTELNLFRHAIMVRKILQKLKKWCGMFCTTVMKQPNIDGMFSHISLPTFIHPYLTMSGQLTLKNSRYKNELTQQRVPDIDRSMRTRFADWFEKEVSFCSLFTCC
jgi:hypothetical protein